MKKIMISLLMVAASLNAMAVTYTGKAKLTLTSSDNKSCTMTIAQSEELSAGLNNGYYAELNTEGKEVQLFVSFGGVNYQQFASNAATMKDLQLGIVTNASTEYTLTATGVVGSLKIMIGGKQYDIVNGMNVALTLPANSNLPATGDEAKYLVQPSAPAAPSICFNYNVLEISGHAGESLVIKKGNSEIENVSSLPENYSKDLSGESGRLVVNLNGKEYQIDANPNVKVLP